MGKSAGGQVGDESDDENEGGMETGEVGGDGDSGERIGGDKLRN